MIFEPLNLILFWDIQKV